VLREDRRLFPNEETGEEEEWGDIDGPELVNAVSRRLLGEPIEDFDWGHLDLERFRKPRNLLLWPFFGR
jgi:hypothetical protein